MPYKDKDKQREAQRERTRRYRAKLKGVTVKERNGQDVTPEQGKLLKAIFGDEIDEPDIANFGQPDCQCKHCQQNRRSSHPRILSHGVYKPAVGLMDNEYNRVSLPGDIDYEGFNE